MTSQLTSLSQPFPAKFVKANPSGGGTYVGHDVVTQRLLSILGPFDFDCKQLIRGYVAGREPNPHGKSARARSGLPPLENAVVGALCTLTVTIDGKTVSITEVGDCEEPHNWPHDGARTKDALSDAIKRCAMRIGLGLHLWSQDLYVLDGVLARREQQENGEDAGAPDEGAETGMTAPAAQPESAPPASHPQSPDDAIGNLGEDAGHHTSDEPAGGEGDTDHDSPEPPANGAPAPAPVISEQRVRTIAIQAKEAGWTAEQKHEAVYFVTKGRTRTTKELTIVEATQLQQMIAKAKAAR